VLKATCIVYRGIERMVTMLAHTMVRYLSWF